jgi:hypothetical protein
MILLYAILIKTQCGDKKDEYFDKNSMIYSAIVGIVVFTGLRSLDTTQTTAVVGENVMTTPFNQ